MNKNNLLLTVLLAFLFLILLSRLVTAEESLSQMPSSPSTVKLKANTDSVAEPNNLRRKYIDRFVDAKYQPYIDSCLTKILQMAELRSGTPDLNGKVRLNIEIWSDGSIHGIQINHSSGNKKLDHEVMRQITYAAPFASFPSAIKQEADILILTREWGFNSEGQHLSLETPTISSTSAEYRFATLDTRKLAFQSGYVYLPNVPKQKEYMADTTGDTKYQTYIKSCLDKILKVVEANSISTELKGQVIVTIGVQSDGTVRRLQVVGTSKNKVLDDEVIKRISAATPFDPFPESIKTEKDAFSFQYIFEVNSVVINSVPSYDDR